MTKTLYLGFIGLKFIRQLKIYINLVIMEKKQRRQFKILEANPLLEVEDTKHLRAQTFQELSFGSLKILKLQLIATIQRHIKMHGPWLKAPL